MKSGKPGETRVGICEEKFFVSFLFSTFGEGVVGLLTFIASMHSRQAASVHRLLLALFSLLREILF